MSRFIVIFGLMLYGVTAFGGDMAAGKALSSQCAVCHGKNGIAKDPEAPNLAGLSARYFEKSMVDFQQDRRQNPRMSIIAKGLSKEDIKNLAAWYSAFELTVKEPEI